ncbi:hypothetical protein [Paraburkholderia sp. RL17-337-BIB-A]|uniref:hypothetical protein n=1 Tax=Paraburkholderia sp. RL17-337-BIB-A TaxID=3031636 RepID=UPI0038BD63C3
MFLLVVEGLFGFSDVVVKWGNVLFFAFHAGDSLFGVFWRCVEECDLGPAGAWVWWGFGFIFIRVSFLVFLLVLFIWFFCILLVQAGF